MNQESKGFICGILAGFFYALMMTFAKLSHDMSSISLVFFRNLICFLALLPALRSFTQLKTQKWGLHILRAISGVISLYGFFYAAQYSQMVNAVLFYNMSPLFIPVFASLWLKEKLSWQKIVMIMAGFGGILLIVKPGMSVFHIASIIGVAASMTNAFTQVTIKKLSATENTRTILFYFFIFSMLASFYPAFQSALPVSGNSCWFYVLAMGCCAFLFQWLLTQAHHFLPATKVGSVLYSSVAFGGLLGWVFWRQIPDIWTLLGILVIIASSLHILLEKKPAAASNN